jgi:nucleoid-associated protein YgaU
MTRKEQRIRRAIFIGAVSAILIALLSSITTRQAEEYDTVTVTVESGDTLWSIAEQHAPNSMDLRDYIYMMYKLNEGLTPNIQPGTGIIIPVC